MGFFLSLMLFGFGLVTLVQSRKDLERRKRVLATPTSRIADAPGSGLVEIKGSVVAGERGVLSAPFSHRDVVWFCVLVEERRSAGRNSKWVEILKESESTEFYVDDGSGQTARVTPRGANVMIDKHVVAKSGTWKEASLELKDFLSARGKATTGLLGFNKSMRYQEQTLSPGDPIYALGPARREPGPPVHDAGYRTTPTTRLVLETGLGPEGELLLTNKTEEQLVVRLRNNFLVGVGLTVLGVVLGLVFAFAKI